eukprot:gene15339-18184_t
MTYNSNDWIAFTDQEIMKKRTSLAKSMNLGGTVEWAIDLQSGTTRHGVVHKPLAEPFDNTDTTVECKHDSTKSLDEVVNEVKKGDNDCAMEQLAYMLRDLAKESMDNLNRMLYGGAPAFNNSVIRGLAFNDWVVNHLDTYFACPAGECSEGIHRSCLPPTRYAGGFPFIAPSKVTNNKFSDVFRDIYVPYMHQNFNSILQKWMFKLIPGRPNSGLPTNMDTQFRCASRTNGLCFIDRFKCGNNCESDLVVKDWPTFIDTISSLFKFNVTQESFEFRDYKVEETMCNPDEMPGAGEGACVDHKYTMIYHNFPYLLKSAIFDPTSVMGDISKIKSIVTYMDEAITGQSEDYYTIVDTSMHVIIGLVTAVESMQEIMKESAGILREEADRKDRFMMGIIETVFMFGAYTLPGIGPIVGATWNILPMAIRGEKDPVAWFLASFDIIDGLASAIKLGKGFRGAREHFEPVKYERFKATYEKDPRIKKIKEVEVKVGSTCFI